MADTYEQNLAQKSSLTTSDYIRVVGSDNVSYKQPVSAVANTIGSYNASPILLTDCNDATDPSKIYYANGSTANRPASAWWFIRCEAKSGQMTFQTAYAMNYTTVLVYQRSRDTNGNWGSWAKMPTRAEIDALAKGHVSFAGTAGDSPTTLIQNGLSNGNIPYNQAFVARISAGYYFWAVGHFYISSNKTYGSAIVSRPGYTCKVNCSAGTWTETAI